MNRSRSKTAHKRPIIRQKRSSLSKHLYTSPLHSIDSSISLNTHPHTASQPQRTIAYRSSRSISSTSLNQQSTSNVSTRRNFNYVFNTKQDIAFFSTKASSSPQAAASSSSTSKSSSTTAKPPGKGRKSGKAFTLNARVEVITQSKPDHEKSSSSGSKKGTSSRPSKNGQTDTPHESERGTHPHPRGGRDNDRERESERHKGSSHHHHQFAMKTPKSPSKPIPINPDYYHETLHRHPHAHPQSFDKFFKPKASDKPSFLKQPMGISQQHGKHGGDHGDDDIPNSPSHASQHQKHATSTPVDERKSREDAFLQTLNNIQQDVIKFEESIARPIQDLIIDNFSHIQSLAMRSRDAQGKSRKSSAKETVHVMENIGGAFRGNLLDGPEGDDAHTWSLPKVDGVEGTDLYSSTPKLDASRLPGKARQLLVQAEKQVLLQHQKQQELIGKAMETLPALSPEDTRKQVMALLEKQHQSGELVLTEELKQEIQQISKSLPLSSSFLPPHVDLRPQREFIDDEDEAVSPDTLYTVSIPDELIQKQLNKMNTETKQLAMEAATNTKGKKKKVNVSPIKLPKESEIQAHYTRIITDAQDTIKQITQYLGYGQVVQTEEKQQAIQNASNIDEFTLERITKDDVQEQDLYPTRNAQFKALQIAKDKDDGVTTKSTKYTPKERVVLPFSSPDGHSDEHLPVLLRKAVTAMEAAFESMKETVIPSPTVYTSMMSVYAQLGLPARAAIVFDDMRNNSDTVPDTTSYNVILDILTKDNKTDLCCQLFHDMRNEAVSVVQHGKYPSRPPTHATARKLDKLRTKILKKAKALGIDNVDLSLLPEIINEERFDKIWLDGSSHIEKPTADLIARPDVVTYTTVMKALGKVNDKKGALKIFNLMKDDKVIPNSFAYTTIIGITMDAGDFKTGLRLFHDMKADGIRPSRATYSAMIKGAARGGEMSLTIALLHQMMADNVVVDQYLVASMLRGIAESGNGAYALRLHSQFSYGKFGLNIKPTATTYNALLELIADPHSWGRLTLPPLALKVGLAVYQEALIRKIFKHPYSERQGTGIIDVRPYTRGSILFPIHFYLNLLVDHIPIYPQAVDRALADADRLTQRKYQFDEGDEDLFYYDDGAESSSSNDFDYVQTHKAGAAATAAARGQPDKDLDVVQAMDSHSQYIAQNEGGDHLYRSTLDETSHVQARSSYDHIDIPKPKQQQQQQIAANTQGNSHSTAQALQAINGEQQPSRNLPDMFFPRIPIPPKGVLFIASKELRPVWTSSPKPVIKNKYTGVSNADQYKPMIEYVENVLRSTRPWIHFNKLPSNPHALTVSSNILRFWVAEQGKRIRRPQQKKKRTMVYY